METPVEINTPIVQEIQEQVSSNSNVQENQQTLNIDTSKPDTQSEKTDKIKTETVKETLQNNTLEPNLAQNENKPSEEKPKQTIEKTVQPEEKKESIFSKLLGVFNFFNSSFWEFMTIFTAKMNPFLCNAMVVFMFFILGLIAVGFILILLHVIGLLDSILMVSFAIPKELVKEAIENKVIDLSGTFQAKSDIQLLHLKGKNIQIMKGSYIMSPNAQTICQNGMSWSKNPLLMTHYYFNQRSYAYLEEEYENKLNNIIILSNQVQMNETQRNLKVDSQLSFWRKMIGVYGVTKVFLYYTTGGTFGLVDVGVTVVLSFFSSVQHTPVTDFTKDIEILIKNFLELKKITNLEDLCGSRRLLNNDHLFLE